MPDLADWYCVGNNCYFIRLSTLSKNPDRHTRSSEATALIWHEAAEPITPRNLVKLNSGTNSISLAKRYENDFGV